MRYNVLTTVGRSVAQTQDVQHEKKTRKRHSNKLSYDLDRTKSQLNKLDINIYEKVGQTLSKFIQPNLRSSCVPYDTPSYNISNQTFFTIS